MVALLGRTENWPTSRPVAYTYHKHRKDAHMSQPQNCFGLRRATNKI